MKYIDLHLHSHYSDGVYSPSEVVKRAAKENFSIISLTDHNGIDGVEEAIRAGKKYGVKVIPGVEIYTNFKNHHLHILGYNFDIKNKKLNDGLHETQGKNHQQVRSYLRFLEESGWFINESDVFKNHPPYIGVNWVAEKIKANTKNWERIRLDFKNEKIISIREIINRYFFGVEKVWQETEISIELAINLIKNAGGMVVLAHPAQQLPWHDNELIAELKKIGLDGIETISSHHRWDDIEHYQKIAQKHDLFITIGSDFHGDLPNEWGFPVRSIWQYFKVGLNSDLKKIINKFLN